MINKKIILVFLITVGLAIPQKIFSQEYFLNDSIRIKVDNPYFQIDTLVGNWHPSVVYFPDGWGMNKYKYWMAWTPNKVFETQYENPCIAYSNDGVNWDTTGLSNPIVDCPNDSAGNYNADTELFYNQWTNLLYCAWKASDGRTLVKQSTDGINWGSHKFGADTKVFINDFPYRGGFLKKICPSVTVADSGNIYYVYARCGPSYTDNWGFIRFTIDKNFKLIDTVTFDIGNNKYLINAWHFDFVKNPKDNHYYLFTDGAINNASVYNDSYIWVARSVDTIGVEFDYYNKPLIKKGDWYRVTGLFDNDSLKLWWGSTEGIIYHQTVNFDNLISWLSTPYDTASSLAGILSSQRQIPSQNILFQNYPNPFNPITKISYYLVQEGFVSLKVYDVLGREIATLKNEFENLGEHAVEFDAKNFVSGTYLYTLRIGSYFQTRKFVVLK
jgi:hypothetical protein